MRMLQSHRRFEAFSYRDSIFLPFDAGQQDGGSKEGWFRNQGVERRRGGAGRGGRGQPFHVHEIRGRQREDRHGTPASRRLQASNLPRPATRASLCARSRGEKERGGVGGRGSKGEMGRGGERERAGAGAGKSKRKVPLVQPATDSHCARHPPHRPPAPVASLLHRQRRSKAVRVRSSTRRS